MVTGLHARVKEPWLADAACIGVDTNIFFPGRGRTPAEAKEICGGCPVRAECLEYALRENVQGGVLGGESDRARRTMRAERRQELREMRKGAMR